MIHIFAEGRGRLTLLIIVASIGFVLTAAEVTGWHGPEWPTNFAIAVLAAAGNAILVANTATEDRVVIDKQTGKEFVLSEKHTLLWIPIKYWTLIILIYPVLGLLRVG